MYRGNSWVRTHGSPGYVLDTWCTEVSRPSARYHSARVYHYMYACVHVHMYASARRMHLSVRGRGRGRGRVRGRGRGRGRVRARARLEPVSTNCVSLRTFHIDAYLCMNVGMHGCIIVCLYIYVCVCVLYIYRYISIYICKGTYTYCYVLICMHVCGYVRARCAHRHRFVCVLRQMPRVSMSARGFNRHPFI